MHSVTVKKHNNEIIVQVIGDFDYSVHREFRNAYRYEPPASHFVIDFARTKNMDSSALGMLLLLREYAGGEKSAVKVINLNEKLKTIFNIVRFEQLFQIK